jgi:hypothetical protein
MINKKFWFFLKIWFNYLLHFFFNIFFEFIFDKHLKDFFLINIKKNFIQKKNFKRKIQVQISLFKIKFDYRKKTILKKSKIKESIRKIKNYENQEKNKKLNYFLGFLKIKNKTLRNFKKFKKLIEIHIELKIFFDTFDGFFIFFFDSISFFDNFQFCMFLPIKLGDNIIMHNFRKKKKAKESEKKLKKIRKICLKTFFF